MLSNLESEKHHLLQIILSGQPELKHKLQYKSLEQFAQRITVHCHLDGLAREEADQYIRYRVNVGGAENPDLFDKEAIEAIYEYSNGIPRLINVLCDTALVYGYADGLKQITGAVITDVITAREEGGFLSDTALEDKEVTTSQEEAANLKLAESRLHLIEERIGRLEGSIVNIDNKLDTLVKIKDRRETIIVELFKMLKTSMERHRKTLMNFSRFKKMMDKLPEKTPVNSGNRKAPFLYRLTGRSRHQ